MDQPLPLNNIDLVYPLLPPAHDAIGEYTALLAEQLAKSVKVRILTSRDAPVDSIADVEVVRCFSLAGADRLVGLACQLMTTTADAIVLQYNPFSWGRRGWAPDLVKLWRSVTSCRAHKDRWAVMFHETYMLNRGWRAAVMRAYQRWQYHALAHASSTCFYSTNAWMTPRFISAANHAKSCYLPVGANMHAATRNNLAQRVLLDIPGDAFVLGYFGGDHLSKKLTWVVSAVNEVAALVHNRPIVFVHIGESINAWSEIKLPIVATGRLPAAEASSAIASIDLMLAPLADGITTRRGSVMAALLNGVPVLSTKTENTDPLLINRESYGIFLSDVNSIDWRRQLAIAVLEALNNRELFRAKLAAFYRSNFSWQAIADTVLNRLGNS